MKKTYTSPEIKFYGEAVNLTKGGNANGGDLHGAKQCD